jgi:hypothetical protein
MSGAGVAPLATQYELERHGSRAVDLVDDDGRHGGVRLRRGRRRALPAGTRRRRERTHRAGRSALGRPDVLRYGPRGSVLDVREAPRVVPVTLTTQSQEQRRAARPARGASGTCGGRGDAGQGPGGGLRHRHPRQPRTATPHERRTGVLARDLRAQGLHVRARTDGAASTRQSREIIAHPPPADEAAPSVTPLVRPATESATTWPPPGGSTARATRAMRTMSATISARERRRPIDELPDGAAYVASRVSFPGCTGAMYAWWFWWHAAASARYTLWYPHNHVVCHPVGLEALMRPGLSDEQRYVGATHHVDEYIGPERLEVAIRFVDPGELGLDTRRFAEAGIVGHACARVALRGSSLEAVTKVHLARKTADGVRAAKSLLDRARPARASARDLHPRRCARERARLEAPDGRRACRLRAALARPDRVHPPLDLPGRPL